METLASGLVWMGAATSFAGAVNVLWPQRWLRVRRRRTGAAIMAGGILMAAGALFMPVRERRVADPRTRLDAFVPVWQFAERHDIRVQAPPARVFQAVKEVSADEIRLFRTLTWLRHPRWPRANRPAGLLAPPPGQPILDVGLRSGFVLLAEDADREIVLGGIVCCRPADGARLLPALRAEGPAAFTDLREPGIATVGMNFTLEDAGGGWTALATETRVHATDARASRRFARYWRIIYPGSALIRRGWLRAIKARAEAPAPPGATSH